jgi:hypothetical protein
MTKTIATKKVTKTPKQASKNIKKTEKAPEAPALTRTKSGSNLILDLCLLMDCTGSMGSWIERSKVTLNEIIDAVKSQNTGLKVRVSFVGYRDIKDKERFTILEFTEDIELVKKFISNTRAISQEQICDLTEDVQGGLNEALKLNWLNNSVKQAFLICDMPGHGKDIN